jgi:uncharacterized protein YraI
MNRNLMRKTGAGPALAALSAVLLAAWAPATLAAPGVVVHTVHMRAGPSTEYPEFVMLPPGTQLEVFGCEQGYNWCDVQAGPNRGWVDAAYLQMSYGGHPVIVADSGVVLALPVVTFVLDSYWNSYYRTRPWYSNRARYRTYWNRYPHGRPPPRPRPPVVRPPPRPRPPVATRPPPRPRPPVATRPPPGGTRPPGGDRPPPNNGRPPPDSGRTRPAPQPSGQ